ncbi:hypothetical protein [Yoonia sp.]|uniref:hypothetical protein n=1 Tax=Yoonia sp. TaxID=2212373 RepID=UPI00358EFBD4
MLQTEASPVVDHAATRAKLHQALASPSPVSQAAAFSGGYLDRDVVSAPAPEPPIPVSPRPVRPVAGAFEDLDAAPLPDAANADVAPTPNPNLALDAPASEVVATPEIAQSSLSPAMMRRIILHATTAQGTAPAYGRAQANIGDRGLCLGIARFCQAQGSLGHYLTECHSADPDALAKFFGPADDLPRASAADLLQVTNSQTPADRLAPVGGQQLWTPAWIKRFKYATQHVPFQDMQFKAAAALLLSPLLALAARFGLNTERGLAVLVDRAVLLGVDPTVQLVEGALTPGAATVQNIATLAGIAAASDLPGRAAILVAETGLGDALIAAAPEEARA